MNSGLKYENNVAAREDISVVKCGLHIPIKSTTYADFVSKIIKNEIEFLRNFDATLLSENIASRVE